jgi:chromosome segregation ATPase
MVETLTENETRSKDAITSLKMEVEQLRTALSDAGITMNITSGGAPATYGRNRIMELQLEQEELIKTLKAETIHMEVEVQKANDSLELAMNENRDYQEKVQSLIEEKNRLDEEIISLKDLLSHKKSEQDRDLRTKEKLENALKQANDAIAKKDAELTAKQGEFKLLKDQTTHIEIALREERLKFEKSEKENEHLNAKLVRKHQDLEDQLTHSEKLVAENQGCFDQISDLEHNLNNLHDELKLVTRAKEALVKRLKSLEEHKAAAELERDELKVFL